MKRGNPALTVSSFPGCTLKYGCRLTNFDNGLMCKCYLCVQACRATAGAGINMAQRVMDCGDAGHILLSKRVADDLEQYGRWRPLLHDLGICEVKHGATLGIVNLYSDEIGNPQVPEKIKGGEIPREKPSAPIPRKSIAVLPFENLSEDKANAYFADGIQEEILATLSRIGDLKVISRTSTLRFKNAPDSISAIAKQLGVANIL